MEYVPFKNRSMAFKLRERDAFRLTVSATLHKVENARRQDEDHAFSVLVAHVSDP